MTTELDRIRATRPPVLDAIGHTPIVRVSRLVEPGMAEVWVKLESHNPTGSYKDRMALAMIEGAEARGDIRPGDTVVEYTGGSTGSSLAFVCSVKGYRLRIVSSDAFAEEKARTMRAFGAEVELIPSPQGIHPDLVPSMMRRAKDVVRETGGYPTDQFNNRDMLEGYAALGTEIADQLDDRVDAFVGYIGTAGCFVGSTRALRSRVPGVRRIGVEPAASPVLSGGRPGTHRIEGGGAGFWPPLLREDDLDGLEAVSTDEAFEMARRAARDEGLWSGPSTGASLVAALRVARELGEDRRVVTVLVDSGLKYLGGSLYA